MEVKTYDVGGIYPRKIQYFTDSGVVKLKKIINMSNKDSLQANEKSYARKLGSQPVFTGDITLFD